MRPTYLLWKFEECANLKNNKVVIRHAWLLIMLTALSAIQISILLEKAETFLKTFESMQAGRRGNMSGLYYGVAGNFLSSPFYATTLVLHF